MEQKEFLERLGFEGNPFQFTNADEEEHLQSYFVPPPYFASVWGDPDCPSSQVVFAPRGGGKSAQRKMIEYEAGGRNVFAITYDRFERLEASRLDSVGVDYHLGNMIELGLLGFLLEYWARGMQAPAFSKAEREQIEALSQRYLGRINRLEAVRALKSLRTLSSRAREFLAQWTGPLSTLIAAALASHGLHVSVPAGPSLAAGRGEGMEGHAKTHFEALVRLIKGVGFRSVYVLVDKVDETAETGNNAESSFLLVRPLLRDLELLQTGGVGFKFFLWDKIEPHYQAYARPDRLQQFALSWKNAEMDEMLSKRLSAFSKGRITNLRQLVSEDMARPLQLIVVMFANGSPRDMIRVCREILSEQLQLDSGSERIGVKAIVGGISSFSKRRGEELLPPQVLRELRKVRRADFTTSYVASEVFKIEANSARSKIAQWTQTGAVEKVGELRTGRRPVHQYAITDVRVARTIFAQMDLADFIEQKLAACKNCGTLLIRDWERRATHTCHICESEVKKEL